MKPLALMPAENGRDGEGASARVTTSFTAASVAGSARVALPEHLDRVGAAAAYPDADDAPIAIPLVPYRFARGAVTADASDPQRVAIDYLQVRDALDWIVGLGCQSLQRTAEGIGNRDRKRTPLNS